MASVERGDPQGLSRPRENRQRRMSEVDDQVSEERNIKYKTKHIIQLFVPVSICMALVVITISQVDYFSRDDGTYMIYTPFTKDTEDAAEKLVMSLGNAFILLAGIVVSTVIVVALYYFRCQKIMHGWLIFSTVLILTTITGMYIAQFCFALNIAVDYITMGVFLWNFAALGIICVHWKGPLMLQQAYLVIISAMMALLFIKHLPDWTVWTVLAVMSLWDLVAVLCPFGPLRILVELSQKRNEPIIPALIYTATLLYPYFMFGAVDDSQAQDSDTPLVPSAIGSTSSSTATTSHNAPIRYAPNRGRRRSPLQGDEPLTAIVAGNPNANRSPRPQHIAEEVEIIQDEGIKLGLGDFIFYSILVGKASSYGDWNTTIACYVAILIGLAFTLMLLAVFRKALPALPISIFAGMIFYFSTREFITPFMNEMTLRQIVP